MKKMYIQPSSKAIEVDNEEVIADSGNSNRIIYGGSNTNGPTVAEEDDYRTNIWGD